ncbi:MAG: hypothetical protein ACLQPH_01645 [Acidimicrobiales bacterium]
MAADRDLPVGAHGSTAELAATGPNSDPVMPGTARTRTLGVDDQAVASKQTITQPGSFCLTGDGVCVGREQCLDRDAQVRTWFAIARHGGAARPALR